MNRSEFDAALDAVVATKTATNTKGGNTPRIVNDRYLTPGSLARAICEKLKEAIGRPDTIIEPSAGGGSFIRAARDVWGVAPEIIAVEVDRRSNADELDTAGADRVIYGQWESCHEEVPRFKGSDRRILILGNPPFDLPEDKKLRAKLPFDRKGEVPVTAERHVRLAMERLGHTVALEPAPRYLAFLLRQSFCAGPRLNRNRLFGPGSLGGLRYRWDVGPRPSYTDDGKTDGAEYNVLVWQAGWRGPYEGGWISAPGDDWR